MLKNWLYRIRNRAKNIFDLFTNEQVRINVLQAIPFWIASVLTGLLAVGYTKLFGLSEDLLQYLLSVNKLLIFVIAPGFFVAGWFLVKLAPAARGSGIPQVMASIELSGARGEAQTGVLLGLRIIIIKILSSMCMVLGGGAIGREGPTIQIAGSVFYLVNRWIPASWPRLSSRSFVLTGAAAGLAAAFNTPLGGIVFAIEELARIHLSFFRTALFTAVIIAGLTAQGILGRYLYLGYPDVSNLHPLAFLMVIAVAIVAGLSGGFMGKMIIRMMKWKQNLNGRQHLFFALLAGLLVATTAYFVNEQVLGSGKDIINDTLFTHEKEIRWHSMVARILGPVLSFNVGAAGGVFAPSLGAGASVGAFIASIFQISGPTANILILGAMVGFLTGVTRSPFTAAILVLEMTDRHSVIFHLMLAAMVANIAALVIDKRSLYEHLKMIYLKEAMDPRDEDDDRAKGAQPLKDT